MSIPDPISTLRTIVGLDAGVTALVPAARVYAGELPGDQASLMPRTAVVLSAAGGNAELGYAQLGRSRVDVRCYGRTPLEASAVGWAVHEVLKNLQRRIATASLSGARGLIHAATPETGPTALRDADGDWPMVLRTYGLLASEVAA